MKTLLTLLLLALPLNAQNVIWEETKDFANKADYPGQVFMPADSVIVIGTAQIGFSFDCVVRAYDQKTGTLRWMAQEAASGDFCIATVTPTRVYVAMDRAGNIPGLTHDIALRALDLATGNLLWERVINTGRDDRATAIDANDKGVVVVGYGANVNPADLLKGIVQAFSPEGELLLADQTPNRLWNVRMDAMQLTVVGGGIALPGGLQAPPDWFTRLYTLREPRAKAPRTPRP